MARDFDTRLAELVAARKRHLNSLSPIHRLPVELLQDIFWLVIISDEPSSQVSFVSQVCSRWQEIIEASPSFWAVIDCAFARGLPSSVSKHLKLSRALPIFIDNLTIALEVVVPAAEMNRVKAIRCHRLVGDKNCLPSLQCFLTFHSRTLNVVEAPNLKWLHLQMQYPIRDVTSILSYPKLEYLALVIYWDSFTIETLSQLPSLSYLVILSSLNTGSTIWTTFQFPRLKAIWMFAARSGVRPYPFEIATSPFLQSIHYPADCPGFDTHDCMEACGFPSSSSSRRRVLPCSAQQQQDLHEPISLDDPMFSDLQVSPLSFCHIVNLTVGPETPPNITFRSLPYIRSLHIDSVSSDNWLSALIAPRDDSNTWWTFPWLQSLRITDSSVSEPALQHLVKGRTSDSSLERGKIMAPLKSLYLARVKIADDLWGDRSSPLNMLSRFLEMGETATGSLQGHLG